MGEKTRKAGRAAALALMMTMTGCAGLGAKKADSEVLTARCNEQATWFTTDGTGQNIGIFICFGERNKLLYVARVMPAPPSTPVDGNAAEQQVLNGLIQKQLAEEKAERERKAAAESAQ